MFRQWSQGLGEISDSCYQIYKPFVLYYRILHNGTKWKSLCEISRTPQSQGQQIYQADVTVIQVLLLVSVQ